MKRCSYLLPHGVHAVSCSLPASVALLWPDALWDFCVPHAHAATKDRPGARWHWPTTVVLSREEMIKREVRALAARIHSDMEARAVAMIFGPDESRAHVQPVNMFTASGAPPINYGPPPLRPRIILPRGAHSLFDVTP